MKFAFLVHPLTEDTRQLVCLNKTGKFTESWGKDLFGFLDGLHIAMNGVEEFRSNVPTDKPWVVDYLPRITSLKGPTAEGRIYEIPMLPMEILDDSTRALELMEMAVKDATDWGAKIVGLGSMTGIVGGRGTYLEDKSSIAVTTGNCLTVFAALEGLQFAAEETGVDLSQESIAVVGVPGSIATAAAKILKPQCKSVLLVGRSNSARSRKVSKEIDAEFTCDIEDALSRCRIVFTATSSGDCIKQEWLSPSSIVVDVAVPTDVIGSKAIRDDVLILTGGLSKIPAGNKIDSSYFFFQRGMIPSCLGETIVLSLENRAESYSLGQDLSPERILEIGAIAKENGFNFTRLCSFGAALNEKQIIKFRKQFRGSKSLFSAPPAVSSAVRPLADSKTQSRPLIGINPDAPKSSDYAKTLLSQFSSPISENGSVAILTNGSAETAEKNGSSNGAVHGGAVHGGAVKSETERPTDQNLDDRGNENNNGKPDKAKAKQSHSDQSGLSENGELMQSLAKRSRDLFRRHINPVLGSLNEKAIKKFVRGEDCYVWDDEGKRYLDFVAGFGSLNLGHNHPAVHRAIETVLHENAPGFVQAGINPLAASLAEQLASLAPGKLDAVFFCNSGTEAVEAALKLARIESERSGFLYCRKSYHGKSLGSLSVTGNKNYQKPFGPLLENCEAVDFGDIASIKLALRSKKFAAFIVEPIQAEGGMITPPDGFLRSVRKACDDTGTLLIIDEVQTGIGRTGQMFASDYYGVEPDIMTLAKSLGGGIAPIGAMITKSPIWGKAYGTMESFALHTSTFGGGSLACACGIAALETIQNEKLAENALAMGKRLKSGLSKLCDEISVLKEVRGEGLLLGLEMNPTAESIVSHWKDIDDSMLSTALGTKMDEILQNISSTHVMYSLLNHYGIYTQTARSNPLVLRIQPPLTITTEQVDEFLNAIKNVAGEIAYIIELVDGLFARTGTGNSSELDVAAPVTQA